MSHSLSAKCVAMTLLVLVAHLSAPDQALAGSITPVASNWPNGALEVTLPVNGVNQSFVLATGSPYSIMTTGAALTSGLTNSGATTSVNDPGPQTMELYGGSLSGMSVTFGVTDAYLGNSTAQGILGMDILGGQDFTLDSSDLVLNGTDYPVTVMSDPGYQVTIPVNGHDVNFVIDTGADVSTISTSAASGLGLKDTGKTSTAEGIGGTQTYNQETGTLDSLGTKTFDVGSLPDDVAGLLGNDVLDNDFTLSLNKDGTGTLKNDSKEFKVTTVPEPATYATVLVGLGVLLGFVMRRRKMQTA